MPAGKYGFEIPTREEAMLFLEFRRRSAVYQAEAYPDAVACVRRLADVTTEAERRAVHRYLHGSPPMEHTELKSTNLKSAGYDPDTKTLEVTFHSGDTWQYKGVASHHFQNLTSTASPGSYFHKAIKGAHEAAKVG